MKCKHPPEQDVIFCTICLPKGNKEYKKLVKALESRDLNME